MLIAIFRTVRVVNLLMIAATQLLLFYFLITPVLSFLGDKPSLNDTQFLLLCFSTILIAAGGYIINDINDIAIDRINKPGKNFIGVKIKKSTAVILYYVLTTLGIAIGVYLAVVLRQQYLSLVNVFCAAVLWYYAVSLKKTIFISNIAVAFMVAASVFIVYLFEPVAYDNEILLWIISAYTFFAFIINWIREIVKDIEDVEGDRSEGIRTLPVVAGPFFSKALVTSLTLALMTSLGYLQYMQISQNEVTVFLYLMFAIQLPLFLMLVFVWTFESKKAMHNIGLFIKFIMLTGVSTIFVFYKLFMD